MNQWLFMKHKVASLSSPHYHHHHLRHHHYHHQNHQCRQRRIQKLLFITFKKIAESAVKPNKFSLYNWWKPWRLVSRELFGIGMPWGREIHYVERRRRLDADGINAPVNGVYCARDGLLVAWCCRVNSADTEKILHAIILPSKNGNLLFLGQFLMAMSQWLFRSCMIYCGHRNCSAHAFYLICQRAER